MANKRKSERDTDVANRGAPPGVLAAIREGRGNVKLQLAGRELTLTHLEKIYFPEATYTKRDVLLYYAKVSRYLLPFLRERPLVLHRYPNGIAGNAFYQKEAGAHIPSWIRTVNIASETKKGDVGYFLIDDLASLLYITNLGCIEQNPFSTRADDLEKPDYMFVDLDPTEGTEFSQVIRAARIVRDVLKQARLKSFVKTSGATGIHIFIPIERRYSFAQVRAFLEIVATIASERERRLLTRTFRVQDRPKKTIFFDVRQNAEGQSLAAVFSLRPREGAPVSTPISWGELKAGLKPTRWNLRSVQDDLQNRARLWNGFWEHSQRIETALEVLEKDQKRRLDSSAALDDAN